MTFFSTIQKIAAILEGKGYGSHTTANEVRRAIKLLGRTAQLAIDVGGNKGEYSQSLLTANPAMEVHIFEPSAVNIAQLRTRFGAVSNVFINDCGLGAANETSILHADVAGSGLASLTKRNLDHVNVAFEFTENVKITRFEDYWKNTLCSRQIDLFKIDVEGHEMDVLEGLGKAISSIDVVQFEFGGCNIDTRTYFRDFWIYFADHGFDLFRITPFGLASMSRYTELDECFTTTNYLARARASQ